MNLAKISANGQITVPVEIRRLLGLKSGDKILLWTKYATERKGKDADIGRYKHSYKLTLQRILERVRLQ